MAKRWLHRVSMPLAVIAEENNPGVDRLHRWLERLITLKRQKVREDPELFAMYHAIAQEAREVVQAHVHVITPAIQQVKLAPPLPPTTSVVASALILLLT